MCEVSLLHTLNCLFFWSEMNARVGKVECLLRAWGFGDTVVKQFEEEEIDEEAFDCLDRPLIQQLFKTVGAQAKFLKHYNLYLKDKKTPNHDVTEVKPEKVEEPPPPCIKTENNTEDEDGLSSIMGIESLASCSFLTSPETSQPVSVQSKRQQTSDISDEYIIADLPDNVPVSKRLRVSENVEDDHDQLCGIPPMSPPAPQNHMISVPPEVLLQNPPPRFLPEAARPADIMALRELLEKNASGSLLYTKRGEVLSVRDRRRLADLVVNNEMGGRSNPGSIPPKRLEELSRAICVLFPKESQAAYFTPYFAMNEKRVLQGGALTTAHLALRREINKNKNGHRSAPTVEPAVIIEAISQDVEDDIAFLKNHVEPWEEIEAKWKTTFDARRRLIDVDQTKKTTKLSNADLKSIWRIEKTEKISKYFEDFKPLQQPSGFILLEQDFATLYPDKEMTFYINWKPFCDRAITALRNTTSLPAEWKVNVDILASQMDAGADIEYVRLLMSLSGLVPIATAVNRTSTRPLWRPSKTEIQAGFVTHVKDFSEIGAEVRKRHDKFNIFEQTVQPFVILVGKSLEWIEASYLVIDKQLYSLETPVRALEVSLKAHFALGLSYSVESKALWLMVQICLFGIRTEFDKLYQCASVIKVLSDFGFEL